MHAMTTTTSDRAGKGGALHHLSEKFYEGGQFMPPQDALASSKIKAKIKFASLHYNAVSVRLVDGWFSIVLAVVVRFIPSEYEPRTITRAHILAKFKKQSEAQEVANCIPPFGNGEHPSEYANRLSA